MKSSQNTMLHNSYTKNWEEFPFLHTYIGLRMSLIIHRTFSMRLWSITPGRMYHSMTRRTYTCRGTLKKTVTYSTPSIQTNLKWIWLTVLIP